MLQTPRFVELSLRSLLKSPELPVVRSSELYSISSSEEISRQLVAIGRKGRNKSLYILGTGESATLSNHFRYFAQLRYSTKIDASQNEQFNNSRYTTETDFRVHRLILETGYTPIESRDSLFREILEIE